MLFKMYRDHCGTIPVEVTGDSPPRKPVFPTGGDQPAVNSGSDTYPLDASTALSEDRKTLAIAVLNSDGFRTELPPCHQRSEACEHGEAGRMAPDPHGERSEAGRVFAGSGSSDLAAAILE